MEAGAAAATSSSEDGAQSASYTYWVPEVSRDAAPLPVPKKIDPADLSNQPNQIHLGSAWNRMSEKSHRNLEGFRELGFLRSRERYAGVVFDGFARCPPGSGVVFNSEYASIRASESDLQ